MAEYPLAWKQVNSCRSRQAIPIPYTFLLLLDKLCPPIVIICFIYVFIYPEDFFAMQEMKNV